MEILLDTGPRPGQNARRARVDQRDGSQLLVAGLGIAGVIYALVSVALRIFAGV